MKKKSTAKPSLPSIIIRALEDLKAQDIITLDVASLTSVFDTMIIASGSSNRQVRALAQHAADEAKKQGMAAMGMEGLDAGEWVLADFGDVVLHVMQPEIRVFYDLESLWQVAGKPVTAKPASTVKPSAAKTRSPASKVKKSVASEEILVSQSDAARARKAPPKPKATPKPKAAEKAGKKTSPPKAGVLAKTGTRKATVNNTVTARKPASRKPRPT